MKKKKYQLVKLNNQIIKKNMMKLWQKRTKFQLKSKKAPTHNQYHKYKIC